MKQSLVSQSSYALLIQPSYNLTLAICCSEREIILQAGQNTCDAQMMLPTSSDKNFHTLCFSNLNGKCAYSTATTMQLHHSQNIKLVISNSDVIWKLYENLTSFRT
jgi:hypothetical protein